MTILTPKKPNKSTIRDKEKLIELISKSTELKRLNVNIPVKLHHALKKRALREKKDMTELIIELIETYLNNKNDDLSPQ